MWNEGKGGLIKTLHKTTKEFVKALFEDFGKNYLNVDYDNVNTYENTRENPAGSGERREGNMKTPENRDEILLEILKELRELNSNVKALTVRVDADREEQREFRIKVIELLEEQVRKPF